MYLSKATLIEIVVFSFNFPIKNKSFSGFFS